MMREDEKYQTETRNNPSGLRNSATGMINSSSKRKLCDANKKLGEMSEQWQGDL